MHHVPCRRNKGREGMGREGNGMEGKGREGKGREGKGREEKRREGKEVRMSFGQNKPVHVRKCKCHKEGKKAREGGRLG